MINEIKEGDFVTGLQAPDLIPARVVSILQKTDLYFYIRFVYKKQLIYRLLPSYRFKKYQNVKR
jgi:hypothetical protein